MDSNIVFSTISNPVRRKILDLLRNGERPAGVIVEEFPSLPQPAISRHLKILRKAGLVNVSQTAQQRIYSLSPENLREIDQWISKYRKFWGERLDSLSDYLDKKEGALGNETGSYEW